MLDINLIREKPEVVRKALTDRQMDASAVDSILQLDAQSGAEHCLKGDRANERRNSSRREDRGDAFGGG